MQFRFDFNGIYRANSLSHMTYTFKFVRASANVSNQHYAVIPLTGA